MKKPSNGDEKRASNLAVLPYEWQGEFGLPVEEHDKSLKITTFRGFAIIDVKNDKTKALDVVE